MKACEALIAWTPVHAHHKGVLTFGKVEVGLYPDAPDWPYWTDPYAYTGGAAYTRTRRFRNAASRAQVFIDFHEVVRDGGIAPDVAHKAFWVIDEYRDAVLNRDFYRMQLGPST